MSETLNNGQNNTANTVPTGWEQMENYTSEPTIASETSSEEDISRQRGHDTVNMLSRLRLDKLPEDAKKKLQDELRKSIVETVINNSDWDGDGIIDGYESKNSGDTNESASVSAGNADMSNEELEAWIHEVLTGESESTKEPMAAPLQTPEPFDSEKVSQSPKWLDSWEEKKKNL